ncbi:16096_t:CDS:1 [Acaulospora morrowiae]|uniref:16096_t:CDS:1 n=1 Tax=Acaulospora morrowiae TaxID=94023 RepID=A0A9N8W2K8_9GLOM|nr:16096_t:CDS:1 [Acaulospora morrowiae]
MPLTLFLVRHGERMDHVESSFLYTTPTPYDPPLTPRGKRQAEKTGAYIYDIRLETIDKDRDHQRNAEYVIYVSPFLRTVETAVGIAEGISTSQSNLPASAIKLRIESALAEWHTAAYYAQAVPNSIITTRVEELHRLTASGQPFFEVDWTYKPVFDQLPDYPEGIYEVSKRCADALQGIAAPYIESLQQDSSKDIVLIIVTHGWCFNVIQEACSKESTWTEAGFCAISRARWIPKGTQEEQRVPSIKIDLPDEDIKKADVNDNNPLGKWIVDITSSVEHLKGILGS